MGRIPRVIHLLGYTVKVKQVSPRQMAALDPQDPRCLNAMWIDQEQTIYLRNTLGPRQKRQALWHEIQHAIVDLREWDLRPL